MLDMATLHPARAKISFSIAFEPSCTKKKYLKKENKKKVGIGE
jgi:hypothetical protein